MKFKISENLCLPYVSVAWVNAFVAKRGAGKTYCASVLAEEMLKNHVPIIVIDGMGIWYGLRVGSTGTGDGLPIVVFGGEHSDINLDPLKVKQIAKAIVETNISAVIDISNFSKNQSRKIVQEFLDEMYRLNRQERHVFIEEADMYAPQRTISPEQAQCLGSVDNFVRRGGNHNLGCSLITQRSAVLNKDLLTQSDCLIILRTLAPQDKKAIQAWVEEQTDEDRHKLNEWYDSLKSLKDGEAWVWHPDKPVIFKKIMFRKRETFHATRKFLLSPHSQTIKLMDVSEFLTKFKDKFEPKPKEIPRQTVAETTQTIMSGRKESTIPNIPIQQVVEHTIAQSNIPEQIPSGEIIEVKQTLPTIVLEKTKPIITVLSEPSTPLGKLLIILCNKFGNRNDKWSRKNIKQKIEEHAWATDGIDYEIDRLIQWEILTFQTSGQLRFYPERVKIVEREANYNEYS